MRRVNVKVFALIAVFAAAAATGVIFFSDRDDGFDNMAFAAGAYDPNTLLLGRLIYGEARGEPYTGQVGVAAVILNRTQNPRFPQTIPGVVFQPGAFDAVKDGQIWQGLKDENLRAAQAAVAGWDPTYGSLYYWNPATATSRWIWTRRILTRIGKHVFGL